MSISVLIVDDIESTQENLKKLLAFEDDIDVCGTAADGRQAIEAAHRLNPDVILMDVNMPVLDGILATEILSEEVPTSPVIIMSVQGERDYLRRAMQAGAREFLIKPFSGDELIGAIRRVHQMEAKKEALMESAAVTMVSGNNNSVHASANGEILLVFSGKGGVGKSLLATNAAVALAMEAGAKVALVDLDLRFGDIGVLLNLDQSRTISDIADGPDVDHDLLVETLADGPEGIKVLLAPASPELADLVTAQHVRSVLDTLRTMFDFVVVDSAAHLDEINLEAIDAADHVIVVSALTIPSLKDVKLTLKVLDSLNVDSENIVLVINRSDSHSDFNKSDIEQNLHFSIGVQIPHDQKVVSAAVNRGVPFVTANPESEISRSVRELVSRVVPIERAVAVAGGDKKKGRRFGFVRG